MSAACSGPWRHPIRLLPFADSTDAPDTECTTSQYSMLDVARILQVILTLAFKIPRLLRSFTTTRVRVPRRRAAARDCWTPAAGCPQQRGCETVSCPLGITSTPSRCQLVSTWHRVCALRQHYGTAARVAQHTLWGCPFLSIKGALQSDSRRHEPRECNADR